MGTKEILDYVRNTPRNTNPSVLKGMLNSVAGGSNWTLLGQGTFTVNTNLGSTISVGNIECGSDAYTADDIIWVHIRGKSGERDGYFYGSDTIIFNFVKKNNFETNFTSIVNICIRNQRGFVIQSGTYGVYAASVNSSGQVAIKAKYDAKNSKTINDDFDCYVYKLTLPNNEKVFG